MTETDLTTCAEEQKIQIRLVFLQEIIAISLSYPDVFFLCSFYYLLPRILPVLFDLVGGFK